VWIFQDGHLAGLLGFTSGPTDVSMVLLIFCIAFGLSMDYEVFLLARIKEAHDAGADTVEAVASVLARTGRIVTTAAALLAITFFAFGTAQVSFIQLFGIGTGIAIVLDATVIRGLLVPAFMRLAGPLNWWSPPVLRRRSLGRARRRRDHGPGHARRGRGSSLGGWRLGRCRPDRAADPGAPGS
jgi:RND superfamily putative drug exporter